MNIVETLKKLLGESGFAGFFQNGGWQNAVMIVIACLLLYLGIKKKFEPLLSNNFSLIASSAPSTPFA